MAIPVSLVESGDRSVSFELTGPKVSFKGSMSADNTELSGAWKHDGQDIPITLVRIAKPPEFVADGSYLFHSRCVSCHTPLTMPDPLSREACCL